MLDLKTIKNITIAEGSVKKITNSSGVVLWQKQTGSSSYIDVDLNNQWIASTKTLSGYKVYMSNSNKGVSSGYASMKFKFKNQPNFKLWINSYAESHYDYTIAWNLDVNYPTSNPSYDSSGVKAHTSGKQYDPANGLTAYTEVDYPNDGGEHFVVVTYRKDSSANANDDRGYVAIKLTLISTSWVVSSTEFIKKDGKYYEKINEVGTYEGGVTANTGNYKQGNELTVTYHQGTADDYIINGSNKYYKICKYVTINGKEVDTGEYTQGDLIGTISNTMKVKYVDGTIKEFTGLTSIESDTDPNKVNAKEVQISEGITSIGDWAFGIDEYYPSRYQSCTSLTSVTIPESVTSIGDGAFNQCLSLTDITIPNSVTFIGEYSFSEINITSITIPSSLTIISRGAFENCSKLESVTIQNSTSKISYDSYAFDNISSTARLFVPSNLLADYQADSNWTYIFKGGISEISS